MWGRRAFCGAAVVVRGEPGLGGSEQGWGSVGSSVGCGKVVGAELGGWAGGWFHSPGVGAGRWVAARPRWIGLGPGCGAGPGVAGEFGVRDGSTHRVAAQGLGLGVQGAAWAQTGNNKIPGYEAERFFHCKATADPKVSDPLL